MLLVAERRRLAYVYVDELADTDPAQIELLSLVAGGGKPLVAFGDPDSSVYGFRGADPEIVSAFPMRFRTASGALAETLTLHTSYRAEPALLDATARVARRMRGPVGHRSLHPPVGGSPGATALVAGAVVRTFRSATSEGAYVAHALREAHLLHGVPWSRMAVRAAVDRVAAARRCSAPWPPPGVPTVTHAEDLPLHLQPAVAPFLLLLRCALDPDALDEEAAVALLHSPLGGADPLAERRLRQGLRALALAAGDRRPSGELLVDAVRDPAGLDMRGAALGRPGAERRPADRHRPRGRRRARRHGRAGALGGVAGQRPGRAVVRAEHPGGRPTAPRPAGPGSGVPRRPTATWTPWWCCSTRRPGSSTGCPARAPRCSSTTCSARTCRPTRSPRAPTGARRCGC